MENEVAKIVIKSYTFLFHKIDSCRHLNRKNKSRMLTLLTGIGDAASKTRVPTPIHRKPKITPGTLLLKKKKKYYYFNLIFILINFYKNLNIYSHFIAKLYSLYS